MADSDARRSGVSRRTFRPVRGRGRRRGWDGERACQSEADAGSHGYRAAINGHGRDAGSSPGPTVTRCISVPVPVSSGSNLVPRASALLLGVGTLVYDAAAVVKVVRRRKAGTADDGEDQPGPTRALLTTERMIILAGSATLAWNDQGPPRPQSTSQNVIASPLER